VGYLSASLLAAANPYCAKIFLRCASPSLSGLTNNKA
jgi:hypothetical protein